MAALLVSMSAMCLMISVALPMWRTSIRREREAELVFWGQQYVRAIVLFQRKYAGTFPPTIDVLLHERFLRRRYLDPITNEDFQLVYVDVPSGRSARRRVRPAEVHQCAARHHGRGESKQADVAAAISGSGPLQRVAVRREPGEHIGAVIFPSASGISAT